MINSHSWCGWEFSSNRNRSWKFLARIQSKYSHWIFKWLNSLERLKDVFLHRWYFVYIPVVSQLSTVSFKVRLGAVNVYLALRCLGPMFNIFDLPISLLHLIKIILKVGELIPIGISACPAAEPDTMNPPITSHSIWITQWALLIHTLIQPKGCNMNRLISTG